jgi:AbrB family looped-hinge helix DNA binding protein
MKKHIFLLYLFKEEHMLNFNDKQAIFGTTKVGERGQLVICKEARDTFDIKPGDTLAVIATKDKGIILIKTDDLKEFAHIIENNIK